MEDDDEQGQDLMPFWLQTTADLRRGDRLRRSVSALLLSSGLVVFILLATAATFLLFLLPSTLSLTAHVFRPNGVKKSWDSINIVLVLVAVVFGFLSRNKNEERYSDGEFQAVSGKQFEVEKSNPSTPSKWYTQKSEVASPSPRHWYEFSEFQDRSEEGRSSMFLRRNSSSYPDLREISSLNWSYGDYHRRFFDDSNVDLGRIRTQAQDVELDPGRIHRRHRSMEEVESLRAPPQTKTIVVDTLLSKAKEAADLPAEENRRDMNQTAAVPRKERSRRIPSKDSVPPPDVKSAPAPSPPPPPPPTKNERKRGGATGSATKDFLNSLYHKKKKTKQRLKSIDNLDSLRHAAQTPATFQIPTPPPPPSPPSVLHNLFSSKKQKRKRTIKVTVAPPAPHPNPQIAPSPAAQIPSKPINIHTLDEASNSGGESPLHRAPPPPPPPPPPFFKTTPAWRFVVQGDYVRVNSSTSSRSGSPDPDELDSDVTPSSAAGGDVTPFHPSPLFCPSPDVDTKAESFITSFRAKLKLEKAHSMKKREPGLSTLGPRQV